MLVFDVRTLLAGNITGNEKSVWTSKFANFPAQIKQIWVIFQPLEVVGCGSETQLQVGANLHEITWRVKG